MQAFTRSGVLIYAKDMAAMSAFYETLLAMRIVSVDGDHRVLASEDAQIVLHVIPPQIAAEIAIAIAVPPPPEPREEQAIKPMFAVANLAEAERAVERCGGRAIGTVWAMSGRRIRDVCDPEGNIVQLLG